jgi:uncharacterized protein (TIGR03663 family)
MQWAAFVAVALLGLALRLPQLGTKPMHTDEAVNAYIVGEALAGRSFPYDAGDRHGPVLAAVAWPVVRVQGAKSFAELTEAELRLTTVLAGTLTVMLFGAGVEFFGLVPCLVGALLMAASSLPVYYDRYFIHESLFVCATFGVMLSGLRLWQRGGLGYAAVVGACAAVMLACKETAVIHFTALAVGALWVWWTRRSEPSGLRLRSIAIAAGIFLALSLALITWLGREWSVLAALKHAGPAYFARAHGAGHEKPFGYYARQVAENGSGAMICALACVGVWRTVRQRAGSAFEFLVVYAVLIWLIYSVIPYKTPWLALNFWLPLGLLAGLGVDGLWHGLKRILKKSTLTVGVAVALVCGATVLIARDTRRLVFTDPVGEENPYAYAHTSEDLLGLGPAIDRLAAENGIATPRIAVIASDAWPLPWYLRRYPQTGFWQPTQKVRDADFYVTTTVQAFDGEALGLRAEFFGLRPGVMALLWSRSPR